MPITTQISTGLGIGTVGVVFGLIPIFLLVNMMINMRNKGKDPLELFYKLLGVKDAPAQFQERKKGDSP